MAALQKIRSKGVLLIIIIGAGLFAFIAEEFFRSIETTANQSKQNVGKIYGETISSQDFQKMYEEYESALKFMRGSNTLSEDESNKARDYVWQNYVNFQLISHECKALGLTVTDAEMQKVLADGSNPMLAQTPFRNEKTGRFDASLLKNFLEQYQKMMSGTSQSQVPQQYVEYYTNLYNYWKFVEKSLRQNILEQKYQILLYRSILSNPVEAKMNYQGSVIHDNLMLASFPYTAIPDNQVKVTDADLQAKYNETKEDYRQFVESRDIKYVSVAVQASQKDKAELDKEMKGFAEKMATTEDLAMLVRSSNSTVSYANLAISKKSLPTDIQSQLDSIPMGVIKGPYYNASDNSDNIIKLIGKQEAPDSILYRQIQVGGNNAEEAHKRADSIFTAINQGADFVKLAVKYGQKGDSTWLTSVQYEGSQIADDGVKLLTSLTSLQPGQRSNISFAQGNSIIQVLQRKGMMTKYNVAVIKRPVEFSKETYGKAYNNFSHFVATSTTLKDIEVHAPKYGYTVETHNDLYSNEHYVGEVSNTRDAMKWIFDANEGDISPLYECGNNDHLMLVALIKVHKEGYRPLSDVKDVVKAAVLRDKKAELLKNRLKDVKNIAQAQKVPGAVVDSLNNVFFYGEAFVKATGGAEPAILGSVWNKKVHDFGGPVKGLNGVYVYEVISQTKQPVKYNEAEQEKMAVQTFSRNLESFGSDLYLDGKVVDKRYLFF